MQKMDLDLYLRELFEKEREERLEREELCQEDTDYVDGYIDGLELMVELEQTMSERQAELFRQINLLNLQYNEECEFLAFKSGYLAGLKHKKSN